MTSPSYLLILLLGDAVALRPTLVWQVIPLYAMTDK